jgi:phosphatidylglycerophosphate synthase
MSINSAQDQPPDWKNETLAQSRRRLRRNWGDYPLTILVINPINLRLARWIGSTSITPNQITLLSFFITVMASFCLANTTWAFQIAGGVGILVGYIVDCLDGDLARLKGLKSPLGAMLDPMLDRFGEFTIAIGAAIGGWQRTGDVQWLVAGIVLAGMSQIYFYLVDAMLIKIPEKEESDLKKNPLIIWDTRVRLGAIEPYMWGMALMAILGVAHWGVVIFAFMFTAGSIGELFRICLKVRKQPSLESESYGTHRRFPINKQE